jgi:uncharacterized protein (TIGR02996 family)
LGDRVAALAAGELYRSAVEADMTDDAAFLGAIRASPEDDCSRLVYADWLEEHGSPRGEFIRVQVALAHLPEDNDRWADLAAREQLLLERHGVEWAEPLQPFCDDWVFRRGFVEWVRLRGKYSCPIDPDFLDCLPEVAARTPVRDISWRATPDDLGRLAASPLLARLSAIDFYSSNQCTPEKYLRAIDDLARSNHGAGLSCFRMAGHIIGDGIVKILAAAPGLPRLEFLDLREQWLTDVGFELLAGSPLGERLCRFECSYNPSVTLAGVGRLLARAPRLTCLDVSIDGWDDTGVSSLVHANRLARLTRLGLVYGVPDPIDGIQRTEARPLAGLVELFSSGDVPRLTELVLQGIELTPADLQALVSGPLGRQLLALTLERCRVTDQDLPTLLPLLQRGRLRQLMLPYNELSDQAAAWLASCPALSRLHALDLEDNDLTGAGRQMLAASPYRHPGLRLK